MEQIPFIKMHGLGNDFVIIDGRTRLPDLAPASLRAIGDRHRGVGYDQLIVMEPTTGPADIFMRIYNSDGSEAEACGNATRCVAYLLMEEADRNDVLIETRAGLLSGTSLDRRHIIIDMGAPKLGWQDIPLARPEDTAHVNLTIGPLSDPVAVNMGNPHAVFFVEDADSVDLEKWGPMAETDPIFPRKANISVASKMPNGDFRLRVWERGVGITLACGSAACATMVALNLRGLAGNAARLHLNGGPLDLSIEANSHVLMGGPVATSYHGVLDDALLKGAA
ncbi:MAG: diaminopimelate epimerase [Sneathiella sp.]|jgi:diaminopimelate epimerase|uniref:diaminopimelate epimerase n=1 Tax=Sneathiella sp. TaxID=1964365 RepID=UPI000C3ECE12|nr:diaminopimelate epimerase [Sneathiella sp.]MAL78975.1 diaminopimelate epimerase [Sneathiella sp.]